MIAMPEKVAERQTYLLSRVADPESGAIDGAKVAIVVAHPDDESLGCGGLLPRLRGVNLVVVTDGAPRNLADARTYGFADAKSYRMRRAAELAAAVELASVSAVTMLDIPDQETCRRMPALARSLAQFFADRSIASVLTHAFEGGHPDHDAVAFCVHAAAALMREAASEIIEMPFYHLGPHGMRVQSFCDGDEGIALRLHPGAQFLKRQMLSCHATQARTLQPFSVEVERYRPAPVYDFAALPNNGRVLYAAHAWGLTPGDWPQLAQEASRVLEIGSCP